MRLTFTPLLSTERKPVNEKQSEDNHDEDEAGALTLTFVNAHLAAFDEMVDRRNEEFHELSRKLVFARDASHVESGVYREDFSPEASSVVSLYETDALFWFVSIANKLLVMSSDFSQGGWLSGLCQMGCLRVSCFQTSTIVLIFLILNFVDYLQRRNGTVSWKSYFATIR